MPLDAALESDDFIPSCGDSEDNTVENRPVQAITFVVDENSGHEDYTCLYRLQVFGKKA